MVNDRSTYCDIDFEHDDEMPPTAYCWNRKAERPISPVYVDDGLYGVYCSVCGEDVMNDPTDDDIPFQY